ncbi:hypothetical protein [Amycolatopsis saalfeldensis]|uniref:Subtilisin inhibitor-like n=1 Tax=Amycolatopsis saalfeldensis TaxID=394193 RepID=A0A1H8SIE9_9PSEU|nr:hypothetical protein [Amycolatopsis saalfeldensis]SEO78154.1 hypothetical protein SAMN04489732_102120 [Amycolatopsis saalfeldensis]
MPQSQTVWRPLLAAWLLLPALAACSGEPSPRSSPPPVPAPVTTSSAAPSSKAAPPPLPDTAKPSSSAPKKPAAPAKAPGACGTVTAASGLTLNVFDSQAGGVPCAEAMRLVKEFHAKIAGRQGSGSNDAVNDTVEGWLCTSGPPAAQGGTTCGKGEQTVFAAVVPSE